jgi:transposase InsO family protein
LLSLGIFLQTGLLSTGTHHSIKVLKGSKPFLTFHPKSELATIYVINTTLVAREEDIFLALNTIYSIDYETMHRRLAHPSKEVLLRAQRHLKDFPDVEFPKEEPICPGCAQGKMTNRSFPPSTRRASQPFQLIHSDLKSFPIDSYRKYKYVIVFLDDYTSFTWTVNLRTKDAALNVTHQFIQLVENRFNTRIIQWMSDAGGEYKSQAFDKMLKDRGIEILQSIPYAHQQNGRAERIIHTISEKAESIRLHACIPKSRWEFAIEHAVHVYN